ncbi:MAG: helix-turn-helix transcriptional regulator [Phenylobacterium sp.]|uniref:helix-turn-helix domain-containing protein n=1 Tax=Phenylobacterium sp. TaxID=1871053 RepID=UPI001A594FCD|nr:helix-turn-helix transcriptional regulator [Phenylobacterium sp.]MBL8773106.1 helix-turn-helix transcriptional regulator [Phenylobacterium sp.]
MDRFPSRLLLTLKALSISRGRLAVELAVDKSVISRWLSGRQSPSGENLANLTSIVAARRPGFSLLDWEEADDTFAAKLGLGQPADAAGVLETWLPAGVLAEARALTASRGEAYEGFWRTTRPAITQRGQFIHDQVMIRKAANGFLSFRLGVQDMRFEGWAFPTQAQLFAFGADELTGMFIFVIFNAVLRNRAHVLDGLSLTCQRVGGGMPVAGAVLMERVGYLTADTVADTAQHEASIPRNPLAPEGSVPDEIRRHLLYDIGPTAMAAGGPALLSMPFATSLSRGPQPGDPLPPGEPPILA